ncbi:MAG TPA: rhamnan synthesis F family protein [Polyangiaceae bacterium]|jgi:lipopolysaccharide biosynthesis protein|nr:rhamnan synthesis F family protein [Polyangiaceae bacterium]
MKRLAIFAHYDDRREVKRYVLFHLRALREVCDAVVFVSTAALSDAELDKVRPLCARAFTRENVGYDFAMWKDGIECITVDDWDELVLTNSSVLGPIWPLADSFARMDAGPPCDFWGMTESTTFSWHLQTYFVVLRTRLLRSESFRRFFRGVVAQDDKRLVIEDYEVGLSSFLVREGFRGRALVPRASIPRHPIKRFLRPNFNPPISRPLELLKQKMPYVKLLLLRENPRNLPLEPVFAAMDAAGFERSLIEIDARPPDFARRRFPFWFARPWSKPRR